MILTSLPVALALAIVILVSAATALAVTFGLGAVLRLPVTDELKSLSSSTATRQGAVLALILALAFNSVMREHNELSESIDEEAVLIGEMLEDVVEEIGAPDGVRLLRGMAVYVDAVITEDWKARDPFEESLTADEALFELRRHVDAVQAKYTETAKDIDALLDEIERRRLQRLFDHGEELPGLFWILLALLFLFALIPFMHYRPTRGNILYIGGFGGAVGIIIYGIVMFSTPFSSAAPITDTPLRVSARAIERACQTLPGCALPPDISSSPAARP